MKYSLQILQKFLDEAGVVSEIQKDRHYFYAGIRIFDKDSFAACKNGDEDEKGRMADCGEDSSYIYIASGYQSELESLPDGNALVCLFTPEPDVLNRFCCLLIRDCTLHRLLNLIFRMEQRCGQLEQEMTALLQQPDAFSSCVSLLSAFLGNPAYAMDTRFKLLAIDSSKDLMYSSLTLKRLLEQVYMPINTVEAILKSDTWMQSVKTTEPVLMSMPEFYCPFINCAIRFHDKVQGYLIIVGLARNIVPGDIDIVSELMNVINRIAMASIISPSMRGEYYEQFFLDVIMGKLSDQRLMAEQLQPMHWLLNDSYAVLVCKINPERSSMNETIFMRLAHLSDGRPCIREDHLYCIFHIQSDSQLRQTEKKIISLLKSSHINGCLSSAFEGFRNLRQQVQITDNILEIGMRMHPGKSLYRVADYRLSYLFHLCEKSCRLDFFVHPSITLLEEYDLQHNTDFLPTLYIYLINGLALNDTAKKLNIHRNTLRYRLERITGLTGLDLKENGQILELLLSYEIKQYLRLSS